MATEGTPGIPEGWWVPTNASPSFSDRALVSSSVRPPGLRQRTMKRRSATTRRWPWTSGTGRTPSFSPCSWCRPTGSGSRPTWPTPPPMTYQVVQLATEEIPEVTMGQGGEGDSGRGDDRHHA